MSVAQRLGSACRQARRDAGLTMIDIAARADVAYSTVGNLETGARWVRDVERLVAVYEDACGLERGELWRRAVE